MTRINFVNWCVFYGAPVFTSPENTLVGRGLLLANFASDLAHMGR